MNDEKLKAILGSNIVSYRKQQGLTQAGLAEKLNYSDKAVSKWERGESIPDVLTLVQVADLFGISVDDLLTDPNTLPEEKSAVVGKMEKAVERTLKRKADKLSILGLSSLLVWFVALLLFVIISSLGIAKSWLAFFYAVPANAIVLLSLLSAWHDFRWNKTLVSVIVWGSLLSLYVSLLIFLKVNIWKLFLLGVPGQLAIFLWFRLFRKQPKEEKNG
jgi:transcriptional regulator with XRE-family HTH domain